MSRFYLHLCDGDEFTEDAEGSEFADFAAARRKAVESLRDVMAGDVRAGEVNTAAFIEIQDENHELIEVVSFAQVVELRNAPSGRAARAIPRKDGGPSN